MNMVYRRPLPVLLNVLSVAVHLFAFTTTTRSVDIPEYNAVVNTTVALPCNLTPPTADDSISLVLWYRGDSGNPIYSVDARNGPNNKAKHFASKALGSRAEFNVTREMSYLHLQSVREEDAAEYRCRVDFRKARTQNQAMKLSVKVPPVSVIVRDSENRTISGVVGPFKEGSSLSLICEAKGGRPPPVVTWWKGSMLLDNSSTYTGKGVVRNELSLLSLQRQDLMTVLTCQASNTNLTVPLSSSVTLDLNLKPREVHITTPFRPVSAGKKLELTCQTYGARPPATLSWWKDSEKIVHAARETISSDGNSTSSYLVLVPSKEDNGKDLLCRAENPDLPGSALEDKWRLNVYFVPQLSLALGASEQHEEIREGSDVYFECNIQANPPVLEIEWLFESKPMVNDPSNGVVIKNQSLLLQSVSRDHRGRHQCTATNSEGDGKSEEVFLRVQYVPVCKEGQKTVYGVARHEDVNITCEVEADPPEVNFRWKFNNSAESIDVLPYVGAGSKSIARYTPRTSHDYGALYCTGRNNIGVQKQPCVFTVVPTGPPDPVENCSILNQTSTSLVLGCQPGADGGLKQRFHLEVYTLFAMALVLNVSSGEQPVFTAEGLTSGSSFIFVLYASNPIGRSTPEVITASTLFSPQKRTDDIQPVAISAVLAVLMGIVGVLVLLAVVIIFIMKTREEKNKESQSKEENEEKFSSPISKPFDDRCSDVYSSTNFTSGYTNLTQNALTERIYENLGDTNDHTYENIIARMSYRLKESYDDITYAELTLPSNQQILVRKPLDPPTEYADIDFQQSRKQCASPESDATEEHNEFESGGSDPESHASITTRAFEDG